MQTLINWTAKRAGGRITIHGVDRDTGQPVKIVGVDQIAKFNTAAGDDRSQLPIASHKSGTQYLLD